MSNISNKNLINFLNFNLKPKIKCDCVYDDEYPPENLISSDLKKLNQGFMAYHVTKPPVTIEIDFISPIDLYFIKIYPKLGSMMSNIFDIYNTEKNIKLISCSITNNINEINLTRSDFYPEENTLQENQHQEFFQRFNGLRQIKSIKIVIRSTIKCPPVLKKLEVWGIPSKLCSLMEIDEIKQLWSKTKNHQSSSSSKKHHTQPQNNSDSKPIEFEIPENLLDQITYEIMTIPMILPSGKFVDQSTIEKHGNVEQSLGRMPSDPFTGQLFTSHRKPIFDSSLKAQIDEFLIKNQNVIDLQKIPRTIGYKRISNETSVKSSNKKIKTDYNIDYTGLMQTKSLNEAVQNALKGLTRYTKVTTSTQTEICCYNCRNNSIDLLYQNEKCKHLICRNCIFNNKEEKICKCGLKFENCDLNKYRA